MKKVILGISLGAAALATLLGGIAVFNLNGSINEEGVVNVIRLYQLAGITGLFSIASFFVGLAYPAEVVETYTNSNDGSTTTRNVVNT